MRMAHRIYKQKLREMESKEQSEDIQKDENRIPLQRLTKKQVNSSIRNTNNKSNNIPKIPLKESKLYFFYLI